MTFEAEQCRPGGLQYQVVAGETPRRARRWQLLLLLRQLLNLLGMERWRRQHVRRYWFVGKDSEVRVCLRTGAGFRNLSNKGATCPLVGSWVQHGLLHRITVNMIAMNVVVMYLMAGWSGRLSLVRLWMDQRKVCQLKVLFHRLQHEAWRRHLVSWCTAGVHGYGCLPLDKRIRHHRSRGTSDCVVQHVWVPATDGVANGVAKCAPTSCLPCH